MSENQTLAVFVQVLVLLLAAHLCGAMLARLRQPRVIGELLGGLILGPSVFGAVLPAAQLAVFPGDQVSESVLAASYDAGLVCLLFLTGRQLTSSLAPDERRLSVLLAASGFGLPFCIGLATFALWDADRLGGAAGNRTALVLVFASALAVTSIPVISRIFLDLGLMQTRLARVVLGTALIEDAAIYAILAVAVGLVLDGQDRHGLPSLLGFQPGSMVAATYYAVGALAVVLGAFAARSSARVARSARQVSASYSSTIVTLLGVTCGCLLLGLPLLIGGLAAGILLAPRTTDGATAAEASIADAAMSTLVPLYFALVGFRIDLGSGFDPWLTIWFLVLACGVKLVSIFAAAKGAGESSTSARNLAVALNARGGPGIVLASIALDSAIISSTFYVSLIVLSVVSSMLAGTWLERARTRRTVD